MTTATFECDEHQVDAKMRTDAITKRKLGRNDPVARPAGPAALHRQIAAQFAVRARIFKPDMLGSFQYVQAATALMHKHTLFFQVSQNNYFYSLGHNGCAAVGWAFVRFCFRGERFWKPLLNATGDIGIAPMFNCAFGESSDWRAIFTAEQVVNGQRVLVEDASGTFDLCKYTFMAYRRMSLESAKCAARAFGLTPRKRPGRAPTLPDYVRCLVEHFFPDELRSAINLMVYHCSGGAPLHDGDAHEVPEEIMSVLDESNRKDFEPKPGSTVKKAGRARGAPINYTPEELKMLVPGVPTAMIVLSCSIQRCVGSYDGKKTYSRHWNGIFRARRSRTEAVKQVLDQIWAAHGRAKFDISDQPTVANIEAALDVPLFRSVGKGTPPLKGGGKGAAGRGRGKGPGAVPAAPVAVPKAAAPAKAAAP